MSSHTAHLGPLVEAGRRVDGRPGSRLKRRAKALLAVTVRREPQILPGPLGSTPGGRDEGRRMRSQKLIIVAALLPAGWLACVSPAYAKAPHAFSGTVVSGTIASNTTWSVLGSPYHVTGDVLIPVARLAHLPNRVYRRLTAGLPRRRLVGRGSQAGGRHDER
jgi:hypothetical protein